MDCKYCKKDFNSKRGLSIHVTLKHSKEKKNELQKPFQCLYCEKSYNSYGSLSRHAIKAHLMKAGQLYVEFYLNGEWPLCKCGCGEKVNFSATGYTFKDYKVGHISRIKNNWGHNKIAIKNSAKTRREQFRKGERTVWNKGLSINTDDRVKNYGNTVSKTFSTERKLRYAKIMKKNRLNGTILTLFGKDHSQWKGGSSGISNLIYADNRLYKEWKFPILQEANFQCKECQSNKELHVHHYEELLSDIIQIHILKHLNEDLEDFSVKRKIADEIVNYHIRNKISGQVLCKECHKQEHPSMNFS